MGRSVNSRVRHGRASCARYYQCKRPECLEAQRRANQEIRHDLRNGIRARVPGEKATAWLRSLVNAGMSAADIAERSGVGVTTVRRIIRGDGRQTYRVVEEALLGVPMPTDDRPPRADGKTDATGTRRRLQALAVQGFPKVFVADEVGLDVRGVERIRAGLQVRVAISTMRAVVAVHDRLWDADPLDAGVSRQAVERVQRWAEKQGWLPTEAWADIDDPACEPVLDVPRWRAIGEDAWELIEQQGYTRKDAAARLGVTVSVLEKSLARFREALQQVS